MFNHVTLSLVWTPLEPIAFWLVFIRFISISCPAMATGFAPKLVRNLCRSRERALYKTIKKWFPTKTRHAQGTNPDAGHRQYLFFILQRRPQR